MSEQDYKIPNNFVGIKDFNEYALFIYVFTIFLCLFLIKNIIIHYIYSYKIIIFNIYNF